MRQLCVYQQHMALCSTGWVPRWKLQNSASGSKPTARQRDGVQNRVASDAVFVGVSVERVGGWLGSVDGGCQLGVQAHVRFKLWSLICCQPGVGGSFLRMLISGRVFDVLWASNYRSHFAGNNEIIGNDLWWYRQALGASSFEHVSTLCESGVKDNTKIVFRNALEHFLKYPP